MIFAPESDVRLETRWKRGDLMAVGTNRRIALLLEKSRRHDQFWELLDRWLNPMRWFRA